VPPETKQPGGAASPSEVVEFRVAGLRCSGCVMGRRLGLLALDGVHAVDVDRESGRATVRTAPEPDPALLEEQLHWLGYDAERLRRRQRVPAPLAA
jgi:copper chaperone CopZ